MSVKQTYQGGIALIEMVIAIVVISIAVLSVMSVLAAVATRSGQSLIDAQAAAIAAAYMEEINSKPFADPDGVMGETQRQAFDDVDDYKNFTDVGARDWQGVPQAGLNQYTITVNVIQSAWQGISASDARRVDITVSHPSGTVVRLTGYRTNAP